MSWTIKRGRTTAKIRIYSVKIKLNKFLKSMILIFCLTIYGLSVILCLI